MRQPTALLEIEGAQMKVQVVVKQQRQAYGRTRYLVTPALGRGEKWVDEGRLSFLSVEANERMMTDQNGELMMVTC